MSNRPGTAPFGRAIRARTLPGLCLAAALAATVGRADTRSRFVVDQLTSHNAGLSAATRSEKYSLMSASPSAFYRGTAHLYWADLGASPLLAPFGGSTTLTWLQGDAHTENQGAFDNSAGAVVYDLTDFDEAVIGDYQLDLWRLGASLALVARENRVSGADEDTAIDALADGYLDALGSFVGNDSERTRVLSADNAYGLLDEFLGEVVSRDSRKKLLQKYTTVSAGSRTFDLSSSDLEAVPTATAQALRDAMPGYGATLSGGLRYSGSYFQVKSVARRLHAGLGSLGRDRYYLLIEGRSTSTDDDRILDVKAADTPSAYATLDPAAVRKTQAASGSDEARRASLAARALGYRVDEHTGELAALGRRFLVRERSPYKESFDTSQLTSRTRLTKLAEQWGATLATAHARADRDSNPAVIPYEFEKEVQTLTGARKSQFKTRLRSVGKSYADQVQADFASFTDWLKTHP